VLAPDLIGFGLTERPCGQEYGRDAWLAHLEAFLDAVEARPASLVGNSLGGALAIALAEGRRGSAQRLALISSPVVSFPVTDGLRTIWGYRPSLSHMRGVLETLACDKRLVTDEVVQSRYLASVEAGAYEAFATMFAPPYQRWVEAFAMPAERLAAMSQPVLIVHGREDRVVPVETAHRLADLMPHAELLVLEGCGHWVPVERADELNDALLRFLAR
jgi:pimeloyl-ACP methyl ester carboxylesterase